MRIGSDHRVGRPLRRAVLVLAAVVWAMLAPSVPQAEADDVPVTITDPAVTTLPWHATFVVHGTAAPGAVVTVEYVRTETFSLVRREVTADADGHWSRASALDVNYLVDATTSDATHATTSVLFSSADAVGVAPRLDSPPVTTSAATTFTLSGVGNPDSVVDVHYHREGTAPDDYSVIRSVRVDGSGRWSRTAALVADYRAFATARIGGAASQNVLFQTVVTLTSPSRADLDVGYHFTVAGQAAPDSVVAVRYDYDAGVPSVVRLVRADLAGRWTRDSTFIHTVTVTASRPDGSRRSQAVRMSEHPPELGAIKDVYLAADRTTVGVQLRSVDEDAQVTDPSHSFNGPHPRFAAVEVCARNRGPNVWHAEAAPFTLNTDIMHFWEGDEGGAILVGRTMFPRQQVVVGVGQLLCGWVDYDLPRQENVTYLDFPFSQDVKNDAIWHLP